jgi:hypothetical protein
VIDTGGTMQDTLRQVDALWSELPARIAARAAASA